VNDASEEGPKAWDRLLAEAANIIFQYALANNQATSYSQVMRNSEVFPLAEVDLKIRGKGRSFKDAQGTVTFNKKPHKLRTRL
jgi:hypothetical protein